MNKYFKPKSVTWWSSVIPLIAGVVSAASASVPALVPAKVVIDAVTGGIPPAILINAGLAGIGLRGAVKD
jgi:hypothetical protein